MTVFDTSYYQLDESGAQDYSAMLPSGGHIVHVGNTEYTVTLFHQMRCLEILRREYTRAPQTSPSFLTQHCLNYLRQTIVCRPNLRLESVKSPHGESTKEYETVCRDWTAVYEEAELNFAAHSRIVQPLGHDQKSGSEMYEPF